MPSALPVGSSELTRSENTLKKLPIGIFDKIRLHGFIASEAKVDKSRQTSDQFLNKQKRL
jgi:hypothetical protein